MSYLWIYRVWVLPLYSQLETYFANMRSKQSTVSSKWISEVITTYQENRSRPPMCLKAHKRSLGSWCVIRLPKQQLTWWFLFLIRSVKGIMVSRELFVCQKWSRCPKTVANTFRFTASYSFIVTAVPIYANLFSRVELYRFVYAAGPQWVISNNRV